MAGTGLTRKEVEAEGVMLLDVYNRQPTFESGFYNGASRRQIDYSDPRVEGDSVHVDDASCSLIVVFGGELQGDLAFNEDAFAMIDRTLLGLQPGGEIRIANPFQEYDGPEGSDPLEELRYAYAASGEDPSLVDFWMGQNEDGEEYLVIKKKLPNSDRV